MASSFLHVRYINMNMVQNALLKDRLSPTKNPGSQKPKGYYNTLTIRFKVTNNTSKWLSCHWFDWIWYLSHLFHFRTLKYFYYQHSEIISSYTGPDSDLTLTSFISSFLIKNSLLISEATKLSFLAKYVCPLIFLV